MQSLKAETHSLQLKQAQNKVHLTTGKFLRHTSVCDLHVAFVVPYVYDYVKNDAGNKQKSLKIMKMKMFAILGKARTDMKNIGGLNLAAITCSSLQVYRLP
jgi:hypothetical protein